MGRFLLLAVLSGSCQVADAPVTVGTPPPDAVVVRLEATEDGPEASVSYLSDRASGRLHTGCWESEGVTGCGDGLIRLPRSIIAVPRGTELVVVGDAEEVSIGLFRPPRGERPAENVLYLDVQDARARLDVPPATYVLDASGYWDEGDGSFSFGLEIVPPA